LTTPAKGAKLISSTKSFLTTDGKSGVKPQGIQEAGSADRLGSI